MFPKIFTRQLRRQSVSERTVGNLSSNASGQFMSANLISDDYAESLRDDLQNAVLLRFVIAYVSTQGLESLGIALLRNALKHQGSFGVASLSCSTSFEPLYCLQGKGTQLPLKYFMDPLMRSSNHGEESEAFSLMHSKLVYLVTRSENDFGGGLKSVVYVGSHNWSARALGTGERSAGRTKSKTGMPRNSEASYRFEELFKDEHLSPSGGNLFSEVNAHLVNSYECKACLDVCDVNKGRFEQWFDRGCQPKKPSRKQKIVRISAILAEPDEQIDWERLEKRGLYFQSRVDEEGYKLWSNRDLKVFVQIWNSPAAVSNCEQPHLLICEDTTSNASPDSQVQGTNRSSEVLDSFLGIIYDPHTSNNTKTRRVEGRNLPRTWDQHRLDHYDFCIVKGPETSENVDRGNQPMYQFNLKVKQVVYPVGESGKPSSDGNILHWTPNTLAFTKSKNSASYERAEGYYLPRLLAEQATKELHELFGATKNNSRVMPVDETGQLPHRIGKRAASHPIHSGYVKILSQEDEKKHFDTADCSCIVPQVPDDGEARKIKRIEVLYTAEIGDLYRIWAENRGA